MYCELRMGLGGGRGLLLAPGPRAGKLEGQLLPYDQRGNRFLT